VNQAITQMDQATQQNAALVEQAAAAADAMEGQAHQLTELVGTFQTGQAAPAVATARAAERRPALAAPRAAPAVRAPLAQPARKSAAPAAPAEHARREPVVAESDWETF
jgi:methyl-accepting chemotaxis protein